MDAFPESEPVEAQEHPTQNCAALLQFKCRDSQFIVISNENFRLPSAWPNPPRPAVSAVARAHEGPRLGMPQQNGLSQSIRFSLVRKATAGPGSRIYHPTLICLECRDDHRRITPEGGSQTSLLDRPRVFHSTGSCIGYCYSTSRSLVLPLLRSSGRFLFEWPE